MCRTEKGQGEMERPKDPHVLDRRLSRRRLLGWSAAGTFAAAAAGLLPAWAAHNGEGVLFRDDFVGQSLNRSRWNPYICDGNSNGRPWLMQPDVAVPSSAMNRQNGFNAAYELPSAISVDNGLTLTAYRGTKAVGYAWTGSVICSLPTRNDFGAGTVSTAGFTFLDARVEVRAKMPELNEGQWPSIWFLPARGDSGAEIDLFEGGFLANGIDPNHLMAVSLVDSGNEQLFLNCRTDLSAAYHTYAMEYRQGSSIKFFFDDLQVGIYTRNVPVGPYFIILANGIASARTADWHIPVSDSTPTVNEMQVRSVRVLSL